MAQKNTKTSAKKDTAKTMAKSVPNKTIAAKKPVTKSAIKPKSQTAKVQPKPQSKPATVAKSDKPKAPVAAKPAEAKKIEIVKAVTPAVIKPAGVDKASATRSRCGRRPGCESPCTRTSGRCHNKQPENNGSAPGPACYCASRSGSPEGHRPSCCRQPQTHQHAAWLQDQ